MTQDPKDQLRGLEDGPPRPWGDDYEDDDEEDAPTAHGGANNGAASARGRAVPPMGAGGASVGAGPAPAANLPTIKVSGGSLAEDVKAAEAALALHGMRDPMDGVYVRGGVLVRLHTITRAGNDRTGVHRPLGSKIIVPVDNGYARGRLADCANWCKWDGRSKADKRINPPVEVLPPLLSGPWSTLPPLNGILETPALLPDGRILSGRGYDEETGLLLDTIDLPAIGRSRPAAEAALGLLHSLLREFPFVGEVDRAVALAAMLSAVQARMHDATPMIAADAPMPGTGKTYFAQTVSLVATGRPLAVMSQAGNAEEDKKRMLAILMAGDQIAMIDNIARPVESDALCAIITSGEYGDRILGQSRKVVLPTRVLWIANGNNLRIKGDLVRRTLTCRMDAKLERPDEREFLVDLHRHVLERRSEFVCACLTVMAAYIQAGRPAKLKPYGSFAEWSQCVRAPLVWLGMPDPCDSREALTMNDPETDVRGALMNAWWRCFGDKAKTIKEVLAEADGAIPARCELCDLAEAVANALGEYSGRSPRGQCLGSYLDRNKDRPQDGKMFVRVKGQRTRDGAKWRLISVLKQPPAEE